MTSTNVISPLTCMIATQKCRAPIIRNRDISNMTARLPTRPTGKLIKLIRQNQESAQSSSELGTLQNMINESM